MAYHVARTHVARTHVTRVTRTRRSGVSCLPIRARLLRPCASAGMADDAKVADIPIEGRGVPAAGRVPSQPVARGGAAACGAWMRRRLPPMQELAAGNHRLGYKEDAHVHRPLRARWGSSRWPQRLEPSGLDGIVQRVHLAPVVHQVALVSVGAGAFAAARARRVRWRPRAPGSVAARVRAGVCRLRGFRVSARHKRKWTRRSSTIAGESAAMSARERGA